ncbi:hypothetical protein V6N13_009796 [Hibiscus sabdariffa]|uniref:Uncharacterized protein n=1 Tax=Hibiscus sabdariffa TaxID=183260 RepID=A0ABR2B9C6_9ROSI
MAWSAVASAVTTIGKLLTEEAIYLWGVEEQVDRLLPDLKWMQNFLTDAEAGQASDGTFHLQASEIRDLAYDAEDVVETFALKILSRRKPGFTNCIKRSSCILHELWMLHQTRSEIDKIIAKSNDLVRRLNAYRPNKARGGGEGPSCSTSTELQEQRRPYPHILDENIVGLDDDIEKLVAILENEGSEYRVVSICGTGGLGKTTLAKKIYQHRKIAAHFKRLAFVYVSQLCQKRRVWEDILSKLTSTEERGSKQSDEEIAEKLFKFMDENKCLVILDDIWSDQAWNSLKPAFSLQRNSKSRILLTSRNKEIVSHAADGRCCLYELQLLSNEESWELFEKIASPPTNIPEFKTLGNEMVECCGRLPLAIIALGGILAKKNNSLTGWREVSRNVKSFLREDKKMRVEDVLALSYDDLPPRSKSCFVYLSYFPEDYEIETQRLIQLLVAEGIVPLEKEGENMAEDVAEGCLQELAERCMIQVREIDHATLEVKTFQMHDLMRELCLSRAKMDNFVFIVDNYNESNASSLSTIRKVRRVSIHKPVGTQYIRCPKLRSLSFFKTSFPKARAIFINLKFLRVLNFEGVYGNLDYELMSNIGNLIHLRFLNLRELKGSKLPSSLGKLRCLLTLDLRLDVEYIVYVPDVIWKMEQLRHLYLPYQCDDKTKLKLGTLRNLRTLVNFNTKNCYLKDLINMINLRQLEIRGSFEIEGFNEENLGNNPPIIEDLEQWKVDEGAMPCLPRLEIANCVRLHRLPDG